MEEKSYNHALQLATACKGKGLIVKLVVVAYTATIRSNILRRIEESKVAYDMHKAVHVGEDFMYPDYPAWHYDARATKNLIDWGAAIQIAINEI